MRLISKHTVRALLSSALLALFGCASYETFPNYARSGDTVALPISFVNNYSSVPSAAATTVTIEDSAGQIYDVKVRNVVRAFSDPTSQFYATNSLRNNSKGQVVVAVDLADPQTDAPLPLAEGVATLRYYVHGSGELPQSITILPGVGSPHDFAHPFGSNQVGLLEPLPQVIVSPDGLAPSSATASAHYVVEYVKAHFSSVQHERPQAIYVGQESNMQMFSSYEDLGDRMRVNIYMLNPYGFFWGGAGAQQGGSPICSVAWLNPIAAIDESNWSTSIYLVDAFYYDIDGNPVVSSASMDAYIE